MSIKQITKNTFRHWRTADVFIADKNNPDFINNIFVLLFRQDDFLQ